MFVYLWYLVFVHLCVCVRTCMCCVCVYVGMYVCVFVCMRVLVMCTGVCLLIYTGPWQSFTKLNFFLYADFFFFDMVVMCLNQHFVLTGM